MCGFYRNDITRVRFHLSAKFVRVIKFYYEGNAWVQAKEDAVRRTD